MCVKNVLRQAVVIGFLLLLYFIELIFSCCLSLICVSKECVEAGCSHWLSAVALFYRADLFMLFV